MVNNEYKRFYKLALALLLLLSSYPLINGIRMAYLSIVNSVIEPEQYAKYVVPYAAICTAIILFLAFQPLLFKIKRMPFAVGLIVAYTVFAVVEQFFERIQIHTTGMTLINPASLPAGSTTTIPSTTVDSWQASLCVVSPLMREKSSAYAAQDQYFYIIANNTYKIHYYLISLVLISMVCGLIYGIGHMIHSGDYDKKKSLVLKGISTAALITVCVFANTTAFFRQPEAIQSPLASVLTCLFFIVFGTSVGVYVSSLLLTKHKHLGIGLAVLLSVASVVLMYIGEIAMMEGGLYRFGTGWFFEGLSVIVLAPVDVLIILLSGLITWLVLYFAQKYENKLGKQTTVIAISLCVIISGVGIAFAMPQTKISSNDILGCYVFDECLYINPLSSFIPIKGSMPYVYGLSDDSFIITNTETGYIQQFSAQYQNTAVAGDEFTSKSDFTSFLPPDISQYKERRLRAVFEQQFGLYQMNDEVWLVNLTNGGYHGIWSIYRLIRTDKYTFEDLEHRLDIQKNETDGKIQMSLNDVYKLARKGKEFGLNDFDTFSGKVVGSGFMIMRYDIKGGCVLIVHSDTPDSLINYARLSKRGYDPFDETLTVDIREGTQAVAAYLNPLHPMEKLKIEDNHGGERKHELIYEFGGYKYYLNTIRADKVFITFENGERLPLKQSLEERRTTVEDLVANGLSNVYMEPIENPLDGYFPIFHHLYTFSFDGEAFYPSASFIYIGRNDITTVYFDIEELANTLDFQGRNELAEKLRSIKKTTNLSIIAGKNYLKDHELAEAGITVNIGWAFSSHTPVHFSVSVTE